MKIESKIIFNKTRNTYQAKVTIPNILISELGATLENNKILMEVRNHELIITKKDNDYMFFVGGYYDDKIIEEYQDEDFKMLRNPMLYKLEEVLDLAFVENVKDEVDNFEELSEEEQKDEILKYVKNDEIADLKFFTNKEDAENYLKECISEINKVYRLIDDGYLSLMGRVRDSEGYWHDIYKHLKEREIEDYEIQSVKIGDILTLGELENKVTSEYDGVLSLSYDGCDELYIDNSCVTVCLEKRYPTSTSEGWDICFEVLDEDEKLIKITDFYSI